MSLGDGVPELIEFNIKETMQESINLGLTNKCCPPICEFVLSLMARPSLWSHAIELT